MRTTYVCAVVCGLFCAATLSSQQETEMAAIPAGEFLMGRTRLTPDDKTSMRPRAVLDDRPAHKVTVSAFQIDRHEVTNADYKKFVEAAKHAPPYHWVGGSFVPATAEMPVYNVNWNDADAYCRWRGERLPTEAEWERAARGNKEGLDYPWGDEPDSKRARFNAGSGPAKVKTFPPNDFGLFDMTGNVSEWTADWFERTYYENSPAVDPKGPASGDYRVIRGGAWSDPARRVTVFYRNWVRPTQRSPNIGFRCAR